MRDELCCGPDKASQSKVPSPRFQQRFPRKLAALGLALVAAPAEAQYRVCMTIMAVAIIVLWIVGTPLAADVIPAPPRPPTEQPGPPSEVPTPSKPDNPPSTRDPGMVKQPETVPHPDSVVTPPVVDPKMAVNPEQAPDQPPAADAPKPGEKQSPPAPPSR
jgi:hypothetical protein